MTELNAFITNIKLIADIGKSYSDLSLSERICLYHNVAYRRINDIYFYEGTEISTSLVRHLNISHCIKQPLFRVEKTVTWPLLLNSFERYSEEWKSALEIHKQNVNVQKILARFTVLPKEMKRMIEYAKTGEVNN